MGDMADFALADVIEMENRRDQYVDGTMSDEEAFEHGFVDSLGVEQEGIQAAWDRSEIPSREYVNSEIRRQSDKLTIAMQAQELSSMRRHKSDESTAVKRLKTSAPICNVCSGEMLTRMGKYGKFYYCPNGCAGQKCVGDTAWQNQE